MPVCQTPDYHLIYAINLLKLNLYLLICRAWYIFTDIIGPDGKLSMATVDKYS
jgi:hypothetical protein